MAILVDLATERVIELMDAVTPIGRTPECAVVVAEPLVSRRHAEVRRREDGRHVLVDFTSRHGTFIAGERIHEHVLRDGDVFIVGTRQLRYFDRRAEPASGAKDTGVRPAGAEDPGAAPRLDSSWETGAAFMAAYEPREPAGRLWQPVAAGRDLPPGATPGKLLQLQLHFRDREASFRIHARVLERRSEGEKRGLLLELLAEEKSCHELVLACAEGESFPYFRRRFERVAAALPVQIQLHRGGKLAATAVEIGEGGAGLVPDHGLELKSRLRLAIDFPEDDRLAVQARVVSIMPGGPRRGVGVEFLFESAAQRAAMAERVARLRARRSCRI